MATEPAEPPNRLWPVAAELAECRNGSWPMAAGLAEHEIDVWPMATEPAEHENGLQPLATELAELSFDSFQPFLAFCDIGVRCPPRAPLSGSSLIGV